MYKIGYTTGVFDLFHTGHLRIIQQAKAQSEHLIVAVSSDDLVFSYKNRYPIMKLEERMEIVSALTCVDQVVIQDDMNKIIAWEKYRFNAHFHGSDWQSSELYLDLKKEFESRGVANIFFQYTKGTSTSALKKRIYKLMNDDEEGEPVK